MAEESNILVSEQTKFQQCYSSFMNLVYQNTEAFRVDVSRYLDTFNSIEYSLKFVKSATVGSLLAQCCYVAPVQNEELLSKVCLLCTNILSRQKLILDTGLDDMVGYLIRALQAGNENILPEILRALATVAYGNGGRVSKFHEFLVGSRGYLFRVMNQYGVEVKRNALQCIENLCLRSQGQPYLDEEIYSECFTALLKVLQAPKQVGLDEVTHCRYLVSALRGLQQILMTSKQCPAEQLGPLLGALRVYIFYGMPGQPQKVPTSLYPTPLNQYDPNPSKSAAAESPKPPSKSATTPSSSKQTKKGKKRKPKERAPDVDGDHDVSSTSAEVPESTHSTEETIFGFRTPWNRVSSSESEYSDTEGGQMSKLRSYCTKVRLFAHACLHAVIKVSEKKLIFGYWSSFLPNTPGVGGPPQTQTLFTSIMKDPAPRARAGAIAVLSALLDSSKPFLLVADDSEQRTMTFTPFSVTLGHMIKEIHRCLMLDLSSENSPLAITQLIKCLSIFIPNVPYQRLKPGLLGRVVKQVKPFLAHRDPNIRVACLSCLGSVCSVSAPLLEVGHILQSSPRNTQKMSLSEGGPPISDSLQNSFTDEAFTSALLSSAPDSGYPSTNPSSAEGGTASPAIPSPALSSGAHTPTTSGLLSVTSETSWAVRLAVKNIAPSLLQDYVSEPEKSPRKIIPSATDSNQPLPVRLESLQLLAQISKNYFAFIKPCLYLIRDVIHCCLQDDDPSVQLHGAKLLDEVGSIMLIQQEGGGSVPMETAQVLEFWMKLLSGPIPSVMQQSTYHAVRSTGCDCISNVGTQVFQQLPMRLRVLCITLLLGLSSDEDHHVRAAAVRALGVFVLYPCLREEVGFVADTANSVLNAMEETNLNVRVKSSWSLGNLSDALVLNKDEDNMLFVDDFSDMLLQKLFEVATRGTSDSDKVKANAVRALGNLLRYLPERSYGKSCFQPAINTAVHALAKLISSGAMKVRWNACYAANNMFKNSLLPLGEAPWTMPLFNALCSVVQSCKNFKVRTNAALAFSSPSKRSCYGTIQQYTTVWQSLLGALEGAETITDFAEFKYRDNLTNQVCCTLIHLVGLLSAQDLDPVGGLLHAKQEVLAKYLDRYRQLLGEQAVGTAKVISESEQLLSHLKSLESSPLSSRQQQAWTLLLQLFVTRLQDTPGDAFVDEAVDPSSQTSPKSGFLQTYD